MAAQNFPVNLAILSDLVNELYMKTTSIDRAAHEKKRPVYERIPELKDLGRYLVTTPEVHAAAPRPAADGLALRPSYSFSAVA